MTAFVTLDGVIQAPGFPDEDRDGGFERGGWTQAYPDPAIGRRATTSVLAADALLLGRRTYELFSGYWPTADPDDPRTGKLNSQPKYVASHTLQTAEWTNTTILDGDITKQVADLRDTYDEISIWGSSRLIATLLRDDLIDEFVLLTYPLTVGNGKRLFTGDTPLRLRLTGTTTSDTGVIISTYRRTDPADGSSEGDSKHEKAHRLDVDHPGRIRRRP
ncbi:dihydrofolate reductase family protein [Nonomuraea sp. SBT364]|uniref:dihydrofolate reductase family protein n=1 Tax=Nonomuraea sp. SBT364 TaxID=1580530 RepID=UPI0018CDCF9F|nr:dihydrofolate reductase family protein [Nonomuraea sp. SBT364]